MDNNKNKQIKLYDYKRMVIRPTTWKKIKENFPKGNYIGNYTERQERCLEYAEKAYRSSEFKDLLMGENGYRLYDGKQDYFIETDNGYAYFEPTFTWDILEYGIYRLFQKTNDEKIITDFVAAMEEMINGEAYDVFTALQYLFCYTENTHIGVNDFKIGEEIFYKTGEKLKQFDYDDLVVTDIKRITRIILKDAGIDMGFDNGDRG